MRGETVQISIALHESSLASTSCGSSSIFKANDTLWCFTISKLCSSLHYLHAHVHLHAPVQSDTHKPCVLTPLTLLFPGSTQPMACRPLLPCSHTVTQGTPVSRSSISQLLPTDEPALPFSAADGVLAISSLWWVQVTHQSFLMAHQRSK